MNIRHYRIIGILILVLGLTASHAAFAARPVKINSADPAEAQQNTILAVTINGSGFDTAEDAVTEVNFLLPCDIEPCTETGKVKTLGWVVHSPKKIVATIEIEELAIVEFRDIEVLMTRGRGGKGTTLFKVLSSDSEVPNNDGNSIEMVCALNETPDTQATIGNDDLVDNPDGSAFYIGGLEKVGCQSGGVVKDRLAGLRMTTDDGGNLRKAIRFLDVDFDACDPADPECLQLTPELRAALPSEFLSSSLDTVQLDVKPYSDVAGHDHIHLMNPGLYKMAMNFSPLGFSRRYHMQMVNRDTLPPGMLQSHSCPYGTEGSPDDVTVYIWQDGVFSGGPPDGLPDGYTVTTGGISQPESPGVPPVVTNGTASGLICSNISLAGEPCPGGPRYKDAFCHVLGKVPMRFTLHMEYQ